MLSLNWIGKDAVVRRHTEVPFLLLEPVPGLSCGDADSGNLIVQGDNLRVLEALLSRYAGQVKCIYIDPPCNTGTEGWSCNDNVNSPETRRWLGEVVGKERGQTRIGTKQRSQTSQSINRTMPAPRRASSSQRPASTLDVARLRVLDEAMRLISARLTMESMTRISACRSSSVS